MHRKIIKIREELCNGCGVCTEGCTEGALRIDNGKARLVQDDFCDGFGDCIGVCPTGALTIEQRDALDFDEEGVKAHLLKTGGKEAVLQMEAAQAKHRSPGTGCPGMINLSLPKSSTKKPPAENNSFKVSVMASELAQWPVQLHLVNPTSDFLKNKELVVLSTCSPVAGPDVHWKYLKGRSVVVACPKLDNVAPYTNKLAQIFREANVPKVIVLRMQVPCCQGLSMITNEARKISCVNDLIIEEHTMGFEGNILAIKEL